MAQYKTLNNFANEFSSSTSYAVGDLVMYLGELYVCSTTHNASAWNSSHFTKTSVATQLASIGAVTSVNSATGAVSIGDTTGLNYLTTAPTADNTSGLKIVVLSSEPATKYDGYIYIITGA